MHKEFLEEMRLEYDRRDKTSESLTKKSNNLMAVSSIIATLVTGFYGSLVRLDHLQITDLLNPVWINVVAMIITVMLCVNLNKMEIQQKVFLGSRLSDGSGTDFLKVKSWVEAKKEIYYTELIDKYVQYLKHAEDVIEAKSRRPSQIVLLFLGGLAGLPISLVFALLPR